MALQGGTQSVNGGDVQAIVVGSFPATYQAGIAPGWVTGWRITSKTATQFTVDFAVPAPAGGAAFDWTAGTALSPSSSASPAVPAGATSVTVTGTFASAYQLAIGPGWMTDVDVVSKTATTFVVNFGTPAPAGGSTLDWIAVVILTSTLTTPLATAPLTGASQVVAGGTTSLQITTTAGLPGAYEVTVAPGWVTAYDVVNKTSAGFTILFAIPAPVAGATVDWIVFGPALGTVSLQEYLDELRDLLHDPNDRIWSPTQKANYINRAIKRRDMDTGANRKTLTFTLTASTGTYTLTQVGDGRVFDLYSITLIWGNVRVVLDNVSLTELNQFYRTWTNWTSQPRGWARQGPNVILIGPTPNFGYSTEWDVAVYSPPLIQLTDTDPLPYPYTQPVPYWAAYQAKINEKLSDEREDFLAAYMELLGIATNGRAGRVPNSYTGMQVLR